MDVTSSLADPEEKPGLATYSHALSAVTSEPDAQPRISTIPRFSSPSQPPTSRSPSTLSQAPNGEISTKSVHTLILDASPLLLNQPSISTLLRTAEKLITSPSVLTEIRDPNARSRVETTYLPFVEVLTPSPASLKVIREFARKTGDLVVLSQVDLEVLALAYEKEVKRNGGDWRLRSNPGQKRLNGRAPEKAGANATDEHENNAKLSNEPSLSETEQTVADIAKNLESTGLQGTSEDQPRDAKELESSLCSRISQSLPLPANTVPPPKPQNLAEEYESSESDSEGWITPSNLKKHQAKDEAANSSSKAEPKILQVATITGDFAMQNVLLQMNLNLLSPTTCKRIQNIRTIVLRCHGCFATCKDTGKQFCPRCGKPTLTRVSCTTNDKGEVKLHLKKNMQWNNKGNIYSIPKPVSGSSNQKWKGPKSGGGKGGWGHNLILAPDQKEYARALEEEKRVKERNLMDADTLPGILTGERGSSGRRIRIGAGRNINSRKR